MSVEEALKNLRGVRVLVTQTNARLSPLESAALSILAAYEESQKEIGTWRLLYEGGLWACRCKQGNGQGISHCGTCGVERPRVPSDSHLLDTGDIPERMTGEEFAEMQLLVQNYPMQPLVLDGDTVRFRTNPIVRFLLDAGPFDMNQLALMPFPDDAREQFAQLIGYSVGGYGELSYVSHESYEAAMKNYGTL
jgi:hypothetical protein